MAGFSSVLMIYFFCFRICALFYITIFLSTTAQFPFFSHRLLLRVVMIAGRSIWLFNLFLTSMVGDEPFFFHPHHVHNLIVLLLLMFIMLQKCFSQFYLFLFPPMTSINEIISKGLKCMSKWNN